MSILPEPLHVYFMHVWYLRSTEEGISFPATGGQESVSPCGCWKPNKGSYLSHFFSPWKKMSVFYYHNFFTDSLGISHHALQSRSSLSSSCVPPLHNPPQRKQKKIKSRKQQQKLKTSAPLGKACSSVNHSPLSHQSQPPCLQLLPT